jgi:hypothetical protein
MVFSQKASSIAKDLRCDSANSGLANLECKPYLLAPAARRPRKVPARRQQREGEFRSSRSGYQGCSSLGYAGILAQQSLCEENRVSLGRTDKFRQSGRWKDIGR